MALILRPSAAFAPAVVLALCAAGATSAQQTTAPLSFEAASVRPNKSGGNAQNIMRQPGGRFSVTNVPLRQLIEFAYQIQPYQLVGGQDWVSNDRFDIVAKLEGDPPPLPLGAGPDHMMLALRTLLADRFKLVLRRETRELDIYALTLARIGGKPGPELKPAGPACSPEALAARRGGAAATAQPSEFCGIRPAPGGGVMVRGIALSAFTNFISNQVGRYVVDRTGLTGQWDFTLTASMPPRPGDRKPPDAPPVDTNAPDLFTAVQEQLGLRLQATKDPVDVFVIESAQPPMPD
jgi:uncharacterized protein (TIGR03435 family)